MLDELYLVRDMRMKLGFDGVLLYNESACKYSFKT